VTVEEVREALAHSAKAMVRLVERSLETGGHVYNHRPDVVALVCAAITHEAHHPWPAAGQARPDLPLGP
jgi:hypothetical protein